MATFLVALQLRFMTPKAAEFSWEGSHHHKLQYVRPDKPFVSLSFKEDPLFGMRTVLDSTSSIRAQAEDLVIYSWAIVEK